MKTTNRWLAVLALAAGAVCTGAIIQAVIPQVVPTANKRGTATIFALANSTTAGSAGTTVCDDGTGAFGTTGCNNTGSPPVFSQTNTVTDAVQTTETSLTGTGTGSNALAANFFAVGAVLNFYVSGIYSTTASPGTLDLKIKTAGGTTGTVVLGDTGAVTPISSVTNGAWQLWGSLTCRTTGTTGTFILNTTLNLGPSSLSTLTPAVATIKNTSTVTVDTTAVQTFDITAVWSASGQSISSTNYVLASIGSIGGGGGTGSVNTGTAGQFGYYATSGSAISGAAGMTTHGVVLYEGTSSPTSTGAGTSGQCFLSNGVSADPAFTTCPAGSSILSNVGAFSTRAGSGTNTGDLFKATDSVVSSIWTGAAWSNFAFNVPVTLPTTATFATAVNVTSSTQSATTGPLVLSDLDTNAVLRVTALFTNTGLFFFSCNPNAWNIFQCGVVLRESGTGKLLIFTVAASGGVNSVEQLNVDRWNSATSFNSNVARQTLPPVSAPFIAMRLRIVGTALDFDFSFDAGQHWFLFYTETKTAFFTTAPDQDGVADVQSGDVMTLYNYSTT